MTESEQQQATEEGNEYNLNTGLIALTGTGTTAVSYFKNDEPTDFVITGVAFFMGTRSATVTDFGLITIIRNPTAGTIFDATPANGDANSNTNFGSNDTLSSGTSFYKGVDGDTITDGTDHAYIAMGEGRGFASINIELPKGSSVGAKMDLNTSGGANVYIAWIGYLKDAKNTPAK